MTTMDLNQGSGNKGFKQQPEKDSWTSLYLPAICAAVLMGGVLFLAFSFSSKSQKVAKIGVPVQQAVTASAQTTPVTPVPETPKKKAVKKSRPANATYVNSTYGVSFSYPRKYSLQSGDKLAALPVTYLKDGSVAIAAVDMPADSYPETDFTAALLNVSVSKDMTSDECMQFNQPSKAAGDVKSTIVKLGANEYSVFEQINGEGDNKSDLKYFHLFKNNSCYEFALAVNTTDKPEDLAQVDHGKVFQQLEKILTTARIKDLQPTEVQNADRTPSTDLPIADSNSQPSYRCKGEDAEHLCVEFEASKTSENAQVVAPDKK